MRYAFGTLYRLGKISSQVTTNRIDYQADLDVKKDGVDVGILVVEYKTSWSQFSLT